MHTYAELAHNVTLCAVVVNTGYYLPIQMLRTGTPMRIPYIIEHHPMKLCKRLPTIYCRYRIEVKVWNVISGEVDITRSYKYFIFLYKIQNRRKF